MLFSSTSFLFLFLPSFLVLYFCFPQRKVKNTWLFIASLFFYAWGEPIYVFLMLVSILANWLFGLSLGRKKSKGILLLSLLFNILIIGFFKYQGFLADNINLIFGSTIIPNLQLPLPIGISFYTLQALSYVIDVYRNEVSPQKSLFFLGMYIACFPQLIAGPIVRYQTIEKEVINRQETIEGFASGSRLFIVGLSKKVLLANTCAILAEKMISVGGPSIGSLGAWAGLLAYTFQIYFDFGGYSDMAIGLGRMMGFNYLRNFNYPYISQSITEFWRRWHISLSTFFRDYVYIPLGGSRVSKCRNILNIAIVWAITGLWHGAAWNYIGWGVYYGLLLILEKYLWGGVLAALPRPLRHLYAIFIFIFGWSFFWITDSAKLLSYWGAMFGAYGLTGSSSLWELTVWEYWPIFIICIFASTPIVPAIHDCLTQWLNGKGNALRKTISIYEMGCIQGSDLCRFQAYPDSKFKSILFYAIRATLDIVLVFLFCLCIMSIVSGSFNPFIYFQF